MSRMIVVVGVIVVVLIGVTVLLSSRAHEKPQTRIEQPVSLANLQG